MYTVTTVTRGSAAGFAAALLFALLLCAFPEAAAAGARQGLSLCGSTLIPALFPMLFVTDYLFAHLSARRLPSAVKLGCGTVFSLVGGFPMGARALCAMVKQGDLSPKRAGWLLAAWVNAGPAFLLTGVGAGLFCSPRAGLLLLCALSAASLLMTAVLLFCTRHLRQETGLLFAPAAPDFFLSLSAAVGACTNLCGCVVLFSCAGAVAQRILPLPADGLACFLFYAATEVSSACAAAAGMPNGLALACAAVSLCGASVVMQLRAVTKPAGVSLLPFLLLRPVHLGLSLFALRLFARYFGGVSAVFLNTAHEVSPAAFYKTPLFSTALFLFCAAVVAGKRKICLFTNG